MSWFEHKVLDIVEHLWPYISGAIIGLFTMIKLWLKGKKRVEDRIVSLEILAKRAVTKDDLIDCKKEVDQQDSTLAKEMLVEFKGLRKEIREDAQINKSEHKEIQKELNNTMHQIIRLHSGDNHGN